ncbi:hypothetical protein [Rhizobium leguminosarum]|uniref:hypothetical protein n=1 Tax=Rhizobium leguminosarum TaxID=384 RepID=UPI001FEFC7A6|nr:hypothetical protein [Rhizobium leguminosarum]
MTEGQSFLETPDGRYIVVRGRLWRRTNPHLPEDERKRLVSELMAARRAVKEAAGDEERLRRARKAVDAAKIGTFIGVFRPDPIGNLVGATSPSSEALVPRAKAYFRTVPQARDVRRKAIAENLSNQGFQAQI